MHDHKVLITCKSQLDSMALLAIPKIGSWNLNDLVKDPNGNEFQEFLQHTEAIIHEVEDKRKDLHNYISASDFENLLHLIEKISERISIASGYAHLRYSADTACNETASLVTRMEQLESDVSNRLLFFDLWFKKGIDEQNAQRLIESSPVEYREYLKHKRLLAQQL